MQAPTQEALWVTLSKLRPGPRYPIYLESMVAPLRHAEVPKRVAACCCSFFSFKQRRKKHQGGSALDTMTNVTRTTYMYNISCGVSGVRAKVVVWKHNVR